MSKKEKEKKISRKELRKMQQRVNEMKRFKVALMVMNLNIMV